MSASDAAIHLDNGKNLLRFFGIIFIIISEELRWKVISLIEIRLSFVCERRKLFKQSGKVSRSSEIKVLQWRMLNQVFPKEL